MSSISAKFTFDLEDRITWDELAPSLQDKFKELWNKLYATTAYLNDRIGDVRITIGDHPPNDPIEYNELWFDTRYMVFRAYVNGDWTLTHAVWCGQDHSSVVSTPEAPLSSNPVTNCHCYAINYANPGYCHCKAQMWDPSTVPSGMVSDIAFNKAVTNNYNNTRYQWIIKANMDGVIVQTLNAYTAENPNTNAIIPMYTTTRVSNEQGDPVHYVTFNELYDPMFDENNNTSYVFNTGTFTIPFTFAKATKLTGMFGRLAPYSNGPVTITLQVYNGSSFSTIGTLTLPGNPQYAIYCHGNCHCARW